MEILIIILLIVLNGLFAMSRGISRHNFRINTMALYDARIDKVLVSINAVK